MVRFLYMLEIKKVRMCKPGNVTSIEHSVINESSNRRRSFFCMPHVTVGCNFTRSSMACTKQAYCMGDLRKENLCSLHGKASIIDFSHAGVQPLGMDYSREKQKLEDILAS
jgi:hypothetical protein